MGSSESTAYSNVGASSSKEGVHRALSRKKASYFCDLIDDPADPQNYFAALHADGAGTKAIVAYLLFRESGDARHFNSLACDSLAMNIDDLACVGMFDDLILSNTIGRNRFLIPDEAITQIIQGYQEAADILEKNGIVIRFSGGETADIGDLVRTLVVDSTLFGRIKKDRAISTDNIVAGDVIIGLSSTGKATYEQNENSGIGSNGLSLARHALIANKYACQWPEILDPAIEKQSAYRGLNNLNDNLPETNFTIGQALLSPTRFYAPVIKQFLANCGKSIHSVIHCTGGGQTKILRFGRSVHYEKNDLFTCPAIFKKIKHDAALPWKEMYSVFNMGHRMEVVCTQQSSSEVVAIAKSFGIEAKIIGQVGKSSGENSLSISSPDGVIAYAI